MYQRIEAQWRADPASEWTPAWEYAQFVDVRDVADAVQRALEVPLAGHHRVLLCAAGIAATGPSLVMAARFTPSVPVRETACFQRQPRRALFDCSAAAHLLGWQPHCPDEQPLSFSGNHVAGEFCLGGVEGFGGAVGCFADPGGNYRRVRAGLAVSANDQTWRFQPPST
jgi:hypothetical protein